LTIVALDTIDTPEQHKIEERQPAAWDSFFHNPLAKGDMT